MVVLWSEQGLTNLHGLELLLHACLKGPDLAPCTFDALLMLGQLLHCCFSGQHWKDFG